VGSRLCTSLATRELAVLWATGVSPGGAVAAQVPVRHGRATVVTERFVRRAHRRGLAVHVWTIDEPAEMRALLALGVDGIVSDFPARLTQVIAERS
jgi:glycerophosphoryl diester phosphodiesterase